jgi:hypothetical protein
MSASEARRRFIVVARRRRRPETALFEFTWGPFETEKRAQNFAEAIRTVWPRSMRVDVVERRSAS